MIFCIGFPHRKKEGFSITNLDESSPKEVLPSRNEDFMEATCGLTINKWGFNGISGTKCYALHFGNPGPWLVRMKDTHCFRGHLRGYSKYIVYRSLFRNIEKQTCIVQYNHWKSSQITNHHKSF